MPERRPLILSLSKDAGWPCKPYEALLESATFPHSSASPRLRVIEATAGQTGLDESDNPASFLQRADPKGLIRFRNPGMPLTRVRQP